MKPTIIFYGTLIPSDDTCITLIGDTAANSVFTQIELSSLGDYESNANQTEIMSAAWTCNAIGYPICNYRALFKYDVSAIPSNAVITNAKLSLHAQSDNVRGNPGNPMYGTSNTSLLQKVLAPWSTTATGWLNQPATTTDNQKTLAQSTSTVQDYEIDVADFVQDWVNNPAGNYGMLLKLQEENYYNSMVFHSGRAADNLKPTLKICFKKGVLPLLLKNFTASYAAKTVVLSWEISDGGSLSHVVVERSLNGSDFKSLTLQQVKNLSTVVKYTVTDNTVISSENKIYYRLKIVSKDGTFKYSNIIYASINRNPSDIQLSPNPVKQDFLLSFKSGKKTNIEVDILNILGQKVETHLYNINEGSNTITVTLKKHLAPGLYIVRFLLNGELVSRKLMKE